MPATPATVTVGLQYTPPSAPSNSGNVAFTIAPSSNSQNVGQIDVNPADTAGTTFSIPFGSVSIPKLIILKNLTSVEIGLRINGSLTNNFRMAPGGIFIDGASVAVGSEPISSLEIVIITATIQVEYFQYFVFGDLDVK